MLAPLELAEETTIPFSSRMKTHLTSVFEFSCECNFSSESSTWLLLKFSLLSIVAVCAILCEINSRSDEICNEILLAVSYCLSMEFEINDSWIFCSVWSWTLDIEKNSVPIKRPVTKIILKIRLFNKIEIFN